MWMRTSSPNATPVIQCKLTHSNFQPMMGKNALPMRISTLAAISQ
jgi:hypothetical protein